MELNVFLIFDRIHIRSMLHLFEMIKTLCPKVQKYTSIDIMHKRCVVFHKIRDIIISENSL
jgi:hypothetical protein